VSPAVHTEERGSALITAIAVALFVGLIVAASFTLLDRSGERVNSRATRTANVTVVDRALTSYQYSNESLITEYTKEFLLDSNAMLKLPTTPNMATRDSRTYLNSALPASFRRLGLDRTYPGNAYTMRLTLSGGRYGWWQPVAVIPPSNTNPNLVLYIRTWVSTSVGAPRVIDDPRIVRADLRPGRFSDYQMLVDGPIIIGQGARISGRVHTNGYPDAYLADQFTTPNAPMVIDTSTPPSCGSGAAFSTASGSITGKGTCGAQYTENDGRRIDLMRGSNQLAKIRQMCGGSVHCPGGNGPWTMRLSGSSVQVSGPGFNSTYNAAGGAVVLVRGSTTLSGRLTSKASLTIGVQDTGTFSAFGSSSLNLVGGGRIGASVAANSILGLIVDGDIVPRMDIGQCPTGLTAAVVSASGTLTIPAKYRVPVPPGAGAVPGCLGATFNFTGSLGTHYMPLMHYVWTTGQATGYGTRSYNYDSRLLMTPPPLFPTTGPWQVSTWKDADPACLDASKINDAECG
jgi:hypothetical protein